MLSVKKPFEGADTPLSPLSPFSPCGPWMPWEPWMPCLPWGPVAPCGPVGPCGPVEPVGPCGPAAPIAPASPLSPFSPRIPCSPCGPSGPATPCGPRSPVAPFSPRGPVGPVAPVAPCGPVSPLSPFSLADLVAFRKPQIQGFVAAGARERRACLCTGGERVHRTDFQAGDVVAFRLFTRQCVVERVDVVSGHVGAERPGVEFEAGSSVVAWPPSPMEDSPLLPPALAPPDS